MITNISPGARNYFFTLERFDEGPGTSRSSDGWAVFVLLAEIKG